MNSRGSKFLTSPAIRVEYLETSNRVIGPIPLCPRSKASQFFSTPMPKGETNPMPVTTTLRAEEGPGDETFESMPAVIYLEMRVVM